MNETKIAQTPEKNIVGGIDMDSRPELPGLNAKYLKAWISKQVKDIGVSLKDFSTMMGFRTTFIDHIGKKPTASTKKDFVPTYNELKKIAKELKVHALYLFIAFEYPGYSFATHVKPSDTLAINAINKIKDDAKKLYEDTELAKAFKIMEEAKVKRERKSAVVKPVENEDNQVVDICDEIDRIITDKLTTNVKPMVWNERGMLKIVFCRDGAEDYIFEYLIDPEKIAAEAMEGFRKFVMSEFFKEETE